MSGADFAFANSTWHSLSAARPPPRASTLSRPAPLLLHPAGMEERFFFSPVVQRCLVAAAAEMSLPPASMAKVSGLVESFLTSMAAAFKPESVRLPSLSANAEHPLSQCKPLASLTSSAASAPFSQAMR